MLWATVNAKKNTVRLHWFYLFIFNLHCGSRMLNHERAWFLSQQFVYKIEMENSCCTGSVVFLSLRILKCSWFFSSSPHWKAYLCLSVIDIKVMMVEELLCLLVKWTAPIFSLGIQNMRVLRREKIFFAELLIRKNTMICHLWSAVQVWQWKLAFSYFCSEFICHVSLQFLSWTSNQISLFSVFFWDTGIQFLLLKLSKRLRKVNIHLKTIGMGDFFLYDKRHSGVQRMERLN